MGHNRRATESEGVPFGRDHKAREPYCICGGLVNQSPAARGHPDT